MTAFFEFLKTLGPARLGAMGAVAAGLIGFFAFLMLRLSEPQMSTLFADLDIRDSNTIINQLEQQNIPYELRQDGATILIPKENVLRFRMQLAEDGLPVGGSMGYELFDNTDTFGTTNFVQNLNHIRALEGELSRTIRSLNKIQAARVHIVLPKRELFARDAEPPSASIVLKVRGALDTGQIRAIQHLTASAVKGLTPGRVSIVDEGGRLLASGLGENGATGLASSMEERTLGIQQRLQRQVQDIVESVVGRGKARVNVNAEINLNRITQTSNTYDPESRVIRSTQLREETNTSSDVNDNDAVTVGNELPAADAANAENKVSSESAENKTEEVTNYEISQTTRTEVLEAGQIKKLSVAVLVDGIYSEGDDGTVVYTPRNQQQLDQIALLVRSAIGYDQERGDLVEVVNLQFAETSSIDALEETPFLELGKEDYFYIAELAVLLIVAALVLLLVIRPLVRRIVTPDVPEIELTEQEGQKLLIGPDGEPVLGPDGTPLFAPRDDSEEETKLALPDNATTKMIQLAQVLGEEQAATIRQIGEMVDTNPQEAVSIIRQWIEE